MKVGKLLNSIVALYCNSFLLHSATDPIPAHCRRAQRHRAQRHRAQRHRAQRHRAQQPILVLLTLLY